MDTNMEQSILLTAHLGAVIIRADGTVEDCGIISTGNILVDTLKSWTDKPRKWLRAMFRWMRRNNILPAILTFASFYSLLNGHQPPEGVDLALVTTAGSVYMAVDFASAGVTPTISGFKFHDCGTGTTAAAIGDTALQTAAGTARVTGTPSNPSAGQYRSVATIAFTSTLAITEWGLFSASTVGTLWDHRIFAALNVVNGDSIQFTYTLTVPSGGT